MSVRAFLLGGSLASPSHTSALLRTADAALAERGARVERWDLAERGVPAADPGQHVLPVALREQPGRALAQAAARADAVVLATPLYHNSYSGMLKNALDHLSARELERKPVALLSHTGRLPSTQAIDHLRLVVRALLGIAIPAQVITVDGDWSLRDGHYRLEAPAIESRLTALVDELIWLAERLEAGEHAGLHLARAESR